MAVILIISFASFLAGFVDAIAGGGGVITYPTFLMLGLTISQIAGTNKLVSAAGTSIAAFTFFRKGTVQKEVVLPALPFTFTGALVGAVAILILPNEFLKPCVSLLVILVALYCYFRPAVGETHLFEGMTAKSRFLTQAFAFALGVYDGFFGPGTGIFLNLFFHKGSGMRFSSSYFEH